MKQRLYIMALAPGWLFFSSLSAAALADGGTVRLSRSVGGYRITAFTAPTPLRAGTVDLSVLVQDAATGGPISDPRVVIRLTRRDGHGGPIRVTATTEAATNKLLQSAIFELPDPGRWHVEVTVDASRGNAGVTFDMVASGRTPRWPAVWPWVAWPFLVVLLFVVHQRLVWRRARRSA